MNYELQLDAEAKAGHKRANIEYVQAAGIASQG